MVPAVNRSGAANSNDSLIDTLRHPYRIRRPSAGSPTDRGEGAPRPRHSGPTQAASSVDQGGEVPTGAVDRQDRRPRGPVGNRGDRRGEDRDPLEEVEMGA